MVVSNSDLTKFLQIQLDHRIGEHDGVVGRIAGRNIDDVGLQDDGIGVTGMRELVNGGEAFVIIKPVLPSHYPKAEDTAFVVQHLQPLRARRRRKSRNDRHLPYGPHSPLSRFEIAFLNEVLVPLRVVELPHQRPHPPHRRLDSLGYQRSACVSVWRGRVEFVVALD